MAAAGKEQEEAKVKLTAEVGVKELPADKGMPDLPVMVTLTAPKKQERAPIDLVALLDVSGSMAWKAKDPKWTRLQLVSAAMQLAIRRFGAADRLAIVPFNGGVVHRMATPLTFMDQSGQNKSLQAIFNLRAGGDTKFMPALEWAKRLLTGRPADDRTARPGFVFLLSDGEDNRSVLNRHVDVGGYPVHTFGMCQTCNPQAMLHVARETQGTYHPIDDSMNSVALALGTFVGGITSVVAVNAIVNLKVPKDSGVKIAKIESGSYQGEWSKGTEGQINVGVLYAEDVKKFTVHLNVQQLPDAKLAVGPEIQLLLTATGGYNKPISRNRDEMVKAEANVKRPKPATGTTAPEVQMVEEVDVAVQIVVNVHVAAIVHRVVQEHGSKDNDHHDGVEGATAPAPNPKLMANDLNKKWENFKAKEAKEKVPHIKPDHVNKGDEHVKEIVDFLEKHDHIGVLYMHSWLAFQWTLQTTTFAYHGSSIIQKWKHKEYMKLVAADLAYHASSMAPHPHGGAGGAADDPCKCVDFDRIDQRLELWSKVKREVPEFFQPSEDAESHHLTAVIREASLDAINKAMHQDMYLAVVHASNLRRCYCSGKQSPSPSTKPYPTPKDDHP